jgi:hypothetical protein
VETIRDAASNIGSTVGGILPGGGSSDVATSGGKNG